MCVCRAGSPAAADVSSSPIVLSVTAKNTANLTVTANVTINVAIANRPPTFGQAAYNFSLQAGQLWILKLADLASGMTSMLFA